MGKKAKKGKDKVGPATGPRQRSYGGAATSRLFADWVASGASADSELFFSLKQLRNRSRALARDSDYINGLFLTMANNCVGCGMTFQAQTQLLRGTKPNAALNQAIEAAWEEWGRADSCHVGGVLHWPDMEQLLIRAIIQDGEVFVRKVRRAFGRAKVPYSLEVIEADQLADDYSVGLVTNGNTIKMGVEMNAWGRPVAYWFYLNHPGDFQFVGRSGPNGPVRIPANEIIHLYRVLRPNQTRGVPWIFSSMVRMQHVNKFEEAEVVATRAQAAVMGFVQRSEDDTTLVTTDNPDEANQLEGFEPGAIDYLLPGETFQGFAPTRPGDSFDPFMRAMLRALAAGQGISYESVSRDYSQTSYSSARAALLEERKQYKVLQDWFIRNFHCVVYTEWLERAVLSGAVSIGNFEENIPNYLRHRWIAPGWQWVDPQKDGQANIDELRAGLTTATEIVAQRGKDYEELLMQRKAEIDMADALGLTFDLTGKAPPPEPAQPDTPKKFLELTNGNGIVGKN